MAKNLKLNIKNTQLAEALKLGKKKEPAAKKEVKVEKAAVAPALPEEKAALAPSKKAAGFQEEKQPPVSVAAVSGLSIEEQPFASSPPPHPFEKVVPPAAKAVESPRAAAPAPRREAPAPPARMPVQRRDTRPPEIRRPGSPPAAAEKPRTEEPRKPARPMSSEPEAPVKKGPGVKEFHDLKPKKTDMRKSFDSRDRLGLRASEEEEWRRKRSGKPRKIQEEIIPDRPKSLKVRLPIMIKDLAVEMKLKASQLVAKLFMQGIVVTLNDMLDDETTVQLLGHEFDCQITIDRSEAERLQITKNSIKEEVKQSDLSQLVLRPPVITFMGHVDHGKTSLIDTIRKSNLAADEAGAITQHIGAFKCHTDVGDLTVLDTPGHEAFSAMRTRGADVTDIVVLVVAGDEGMRAQTIEAMQQAQEAHVPIVVAINKSDKPGFNPETVYRQLSEHNLLPEVWGGTTITVNCSALTGAGIKDLLEMLALQAEILELKANPKMRARGSIIESEMHKGLGPVATVLVQNGTLRLGDACVIGHHWARVKTMHDDKGKELKEAGPSTPVKITGLSGVPLAGSEFIVVKNEREARDLAHERSLGEKRTLMLQTKAPGLEGLLKQKAELGEKKVLNLILRADVQGSLEALRNSLMKITSNKVFINITSAAVGEITESDVELAAASKATILGFHTKVESNAEPLIKETKVVVKLHDIIYHAVDDMREIMLGLLDKIPQENDVGAALVKATFKSSQLGNIAGCQVTEGSIRRNHHMRVVRNQEVIWKGSISSLKRVKEDVREVTKGMECGILLNGFSDFKEGDILQAYEVTYLQQEL